MPRLGAIRSALLRLRRARISKRLIGVFTIGAGLVEPQPPVLDRPLRDSNRGRIGAAGPSSVQRRAGLCTRVPRQKRNYLSSLGFWALRNQQVGGSSPPVGPMISRPCDPSASRDRRGIRWRGKERRPERSRGLCGSPGGSTKRHPRRTGSSQGKTPWMISPSISTASGVACAIS
jgi:hypothetical protein